MKQPNHLTDHEIAQYIAEGQNLEDNERFEAHIAKCERCRARLLQSERRELGILETGLGTATPFPDCPANETLQGFALGTCASDISRQLMLHVADCSYCAPLLRVYLAALTEETDAEPAGMAGPAPARALRQFFRNFFSFVGQLPAWQKISGAVGVASVLAMAWPGPVLLNLYQLHEAEKYVAASFRERPPTELRTRWSPYPMGDYQIMEGGHPSPADYPNLASATQLATSNLNSADPRWIRLRGRVKLLLGEDGDATTLLATAKEKGLDDPTTEIDLAVAYFQRDIEKKGADNKSPANLDESFQLLNKVLRRPKLGPQERAIALFDLAVVYEKMQLWDQAVLTWNKYLDLDVAGPWHEEALHRLEEAKKKISAKPQGYRGPSFFFRHFADRDVRQNLEEYQDVALRAWLVDAATHQNSEAALAIQKLAQLLEATHGDPWMNDFLNARRAGDLPALQAFTAAISENQHGQYASAQSHAWQALQVFAKNGNSAGELRARFEMVYAHQRLLERENCLKEEQAFEKKGLPARYKWLQIQAALEKAICLNFETKVEAAQEQLDQALKGAIASGFRILALRAYAFKADIQQAQGNCNQTWQDVQAGLGLYWQGPASPLRLHEFLSPLKLCLQDKKFLYAAAALEERMITLLEREMAREDEDVSLEIFDHRMLAEILREVGEYGAAADQEQIVLSLMSQDNTETAQLFKLPIQLKLADLQLEQGDAEASLVTIGEAEKVLTGTDTDLFRPEFFRIRGDIHLVRQEWPEAEEDYKKAVEFSEKYLRQSVQDKHRKAEIEKAGDVYRGLVEVFLQQKKGNEEALQLWEWYQARSAPRKSPAEFASSVPTWQEIEQTVLGQPLPSISTTRVVYASTRNHLHIWTVGSDGITTVSIPEKRQDLIRKIREYVEKCSTRQDPEMHLPPPDVESKELFSLLLQPVMAHLHPSETVVIDLDAGMDRLPLEALKSPEGWYFGEKFPVVYSPGFLQENDLRPQQKPRLGLRIYALSPGESGRFSSVFPGIKMMEGGDIDPAGLPVLLKSSEIFVFLGHGESGGLVLRKGESHLTAKTFPPESLQQMQLVVLAACSTGVATDDAPDTSNLVHAFHSGGTPSVIASHWNVNMEATSELMTSFSRHLANGESVAHALYEARRETIRKYEHPYYWSGFVLSGRA